MKADKINPFLQGNYGPLQEEFNFENITDIIGEIPLELNGVLYRNGPNPQFPSNNHWFEGDGMIHAISIHEGKIGYRNRWVETEKLKAERAAGKALYNNFGNAGKSNEDKSNNGTANTNIIRHAGKLLALQEGSYPVELNPYDLSTKGKWDYQGQVAQMSAHPHFDERAGEMHNHAYTAGSNDVTYYIFDREGIVSKKTLIEAPYSSFMHDFYITENYVLFPVMPLTFCRERVQQGKPFIAWEGNKSAFIGIMPRNGQNKDVIWFEVEPFYAFHFMNAYEVGDAIILDGMKSKRAHLFPDVQGNFADPLQYPPILTRWTLDLKTKKATEIALDSIPAEFPRLDERFTGRAYRHGYAGACVGPDRKTLELNALVHYDFKTDKQTLRQFSASQTPNEPVFVPRKKDSAEGDGFILSLVYDARRDATDFYIFDAQQIDKEPIAIVKLPHRIPYGFHGNWYDSE